MKTYILDDDTNSATLRVIEEDGTIRFIPIDLGNSDYQAYLRWLENPNAEEGGTL